MTDKNSCRLTLDCFCNEQRCITAGKRGWHQESKCLLIEEKVSWREEKGLQAENY
jgi:hypothetical protein